jgi:ankyrin repeat protein
MAAQKGDARTVELLLNAGADVHRRSATGLTPAQEARRRGHDSLAAVIEAHG